ncbi:hypothetical protein LA5095_03982 [Roseibium album]|uniref:Uncharacterized protein n=1 Tax=Roseibium album TaxID=311410 RepID=A0A0M7AYZ4_9HYPH|nr:hypothetical protein LA5094_05257 [Roseibium album]CTQ77679.1 hypothetical protein LA5095_03982 [Roseibium album]CTQ79662.1 hypothetical protein LA5096_06315 [Roseibium album]
MKIDTSGKFAFVSFPSKLGSNFHVTARYVTFYSIKYCCKSPWRNVLRFELDTKICALKFIISYF